MLHKNISEENTIDVTVDIYESGFKPNFRHRVMVNPDFPDVVDILYQELEGEAYVTKSKIENLDKALWDKISYAVDVVLKNSI